ncbi:MULTISPECIES: RidA family protein [unclassified Sphingopyxis]|jgi:2-iminobutanoate/2-iminopropanoate deaminase|uniref:RidA family protein n=1 Tax=unclassified Sphingopyxis TaxID=2614943 RepID=UPI0024ADE0DF|nr:MULTISPECIES: RidA family protein [unclassified Sphingopyxis]
MIEIVKLKTGSRYEDLASYSRLVSVDNWIFVSNTAGRNPLTQEIPEDVTEQTEQVLANIERALQAVDASLGDVVASRIFIQDPSDTPAVMAKIGERFRGVDPAMTLTCPPLSSAVYKVELEVTAYRGASKGNVEVRKI